MREPTQQLAYSNAYRENRKIAAASWFAGLRDFRVAIFCGRPFAGE